MLRNKAQTSLREGQILQQLAQTLTGSLQIKEVINAFFNATQQLLGVDFSVFSLVDAQRQRVQAIDGYNITADHIRRAVMSKELKKKSTGEILGRAADRQTARKPGDMVSWSNSVSNSADARRTFGRWADLLIGFLDRQQSSD